MPLSKVIECRNRVFSALKKTLYCCLSLFGYLSQQTFTSLTGLEGIWTIAVLGCSYYIVHPQIKISWKCTYPQAIQDEDVFLHWNKCGFFLHYITCSPMDPLQWMDAIRMRAQTAEIIIHKIFRYFEEKNCLFLISKSIMTFLTSNQNISSLTIILLSSVKKSSCLNQERNMHRSSTVYKWKQNGSKQMCRWILMWENNSQWSFLTEGSAIMDYGLVFCPEVTI